MSKTAIVIPARMASTRLPGKVMKKIHKNKRMIEMVYEQAIKSAIGDVIVACDSQEIFDLITRRGGKAVITDPFLPSGTDRVYHAIKKVNHDYKIIINLQGDLPNIHPDVIKDSKDALIELNSDIGTVAYKVKNDLEIENNFDKVKIALAFKKDKIAKALYFSREKIPHNSNNLYHHIGIYSYKIETLQKFVSLKEGILEKTEKLEQLRALENDLTIGVKVTDIDEPISVDNENDLIKIRNLYKNV